MALLAGFEARGGGAHAGAVESMALRRGGFPVRWVEPAQGGADFISSTEWIEPLAGGAGGKGPSAARLFRVIGANHGLNGPDAAGMAVIDAALAWLLGESPAAQGGGGE